MTSKFFYSFLLLPFFMLNVFAQEIEFPLSSNPVIKEFIRKNPPGQQSNLRMSQSALPLPFEDDFSTPGIFPNIQMWMDSDVFVNPTFCDNPISIGVATFDGINKFGEPHDSSSTSVQPVICDYLTSQPIDLTTVSASDSVYFSFFYQPQGLGDEPEDGDSLVLEFYTVDSNWVHIWVANGRPDSAFAEVRIKIENAAYFWENFQFRFYNYATPNGNRDHWNIDYLKLKKNETYNQLLNEITLVNPIKSYLKEYTAMPYPHYKSEVQNGNNPVADTLSDLIRIYDFSGTTTLQLFSDITDAVGGLISTIPSPPLSVTSTFFDADFLLSPPASVFPSTTAENADFHVKHYYTGTHAGDTLFHNDSTFHTQHFYNYYAYDDGSAESATGVHVAYTSYAYRFDVKKGDSLLGISIYFNPWGKNVHLDLFTLCLWSNIDVAANTSTIVYQSIDNIPANNDSINGFVDYYFDAPPVVSPGVNYIGITQSSINEIGLGVDHNTDSHDKMFLNFNNQWFQSGITGSWMMRPIFGKKLSIDVNEIAENTSLFEIYPNPVSKVVKVLFAKPAAKADVTICNVLGETVYRTLLTGGRHPLSIDISSLQDGIYFIRLTQDLNSYSEVKKLVVRH